MRDYQNLSDILNASTSVTMKKNLQYLYVFYVGEYVYKSKSLIIWILSVTKCDITFVLSIWHQLRHRKKWKNSVAERNINMKNVNIHCVVILVLAFKMSDRFCAYQRCRFWFHLFCDFTSSAGIGNGSSVYRRNDRVPESVAALNYTDSKGHEILRLWLKGKFANDFPAVVAGRPKTDGRAHASYRKRRRVFGFSSKWPCSGKCRRFKLYSFER